MEQFQQVQVVLEMHQRRDVVVSECRIAAINDALEVFGGYLGRRNVQRQYTMCKFRKWEIPPALPVRRLWNILRNVEPTVGCKHGEDRLEIRRSESRWGFGEETNDLFERQKLVCAARGEIFHGGGWMKSHSI